MNPYDLSILIKSIFYLRQFKIDLLNFSRFRDSNRSYFTFDRSNVCPLLTSSPDLLHTIFFRSGTVMKHKSWAVYKAGTLESWKLAPSGTTILTINAASSWQLSANYYDVTTSVFPGLNTAHDPRHFSFCECTILFSHISITYLITFIDFSFGFLSKQFCFGLNIRYIWKYFRIFGIFPEKKENFIFN